LRGSGIHVSLLEPGPIETRFRSNAFAAYKRHIDPQKSVHRNHYRKLEERLIKAGPAAPFTLPPEAVLKKVIHALESRRPRACYYVTFPTYLFAVLKRLLTQDTLDWVLVRI
jgi:short-subunit dehydrogenase